jgi:hypothetical protein
VPKLVWRVKPVTELQAGETTEVEVARLERDEQAGLADLGLGLAEAKRLTAAIQAEIVPAQVTIASENRRTCVACGRVLASKGHYIPDRLVVWLGEPVVVGLDGGYVRSRHRQDERHFEVIAGKVIDAQGSRSCFAFARNSPTIASSAFKQALAVAGVTADTPATVLCDGDAGLWRLQREALPNATIVLDWWHAAVRFEHALQAARGLDAADAHLAVEAVGGLERAKWRLWHGRWPGCRRKLAAYIDMRHG